MGRQWLGAPELQHTNLSQELKESKLFLGKLVKWKSMKYVWEFCRQHPQSSDELGEEEEGEGRRAEPVLTIRIGRLLDST